MKIHFLVFGLLASAGAAASAQSGGNPVGAVFETEFNDLTITRWAEQDPPGKYDVAGRYEYGGGRIEGTVTGNVLTGYWLQEESPTSCDRPQGGTTHWGRIRFTFNADRTEFTGLWSDCGDAPTKPWAGRRVQR